VNPFLGYDFLDDKQLEALKKVDFLVALASHELPATAGAHVALPSLTRAERAGRFVSMDGNRIEARDALETSLRDRQIHSAVSQKLNFVMDLIS